MVEPSPQEENIKKPLVQETSKKTKFWESLVDFLEFVAITAAIVVPIRVFIAQPFIVNGQSMFNTFDHGQYLIVDQLSYRFNEPQRGDVVIFRFPEDPKRFFIKRVIGLPGETIEFTNGHPIIANDQYPDGLLLEEEYVQTPVQSDRTWYLAQDEYFVMGDNRPNSLDSRKWGPLDKSFIIGRAFVRLLPFSEAQTHPGDYRDHYQELFSNPQDKASENEEVEEELQEISEEIEETEATEEGGAQDQN